VSLVGLGGVERGWVRIGQVGCGLVRLGQVDVVKFDEAGSGL
jgi:hypothetical protein